MNDLIFIIVPIYKVENYLDNCLKSIQHQIYTNFEVLLINDGSPDNSETICLEYVNKDSRFKYFFKENGGVSSARNLGLDNAKGKFVVFIDSDDTVEKNYLKDFFQEKLKRDTLIVHDINRISCDKTKIKNFLSYNDLKIDLKDPIPLLSNLSSLDGHPINKLFFLELINENNIRFNTNITLREDRVFFYNYLKQVRYIHYLNISNYNYFL